VGHISAQVHKLYCTLFTLYSLYIPPYSLYPQILLLLRRQARFHRVARSAGASGQRIFGHPALLLLAVRYSTILTVLYSPYSLYTLHSSFSSGTDLGTILITLYSHTIRIISGADLGQLEARLSQQKAAQQQEAQVLYSRWYTLYSYSYAHYTHALYYYTYTHALYCYTILMHFTTTPPLYSYTRAIYASSHQTPLPRRWSMRGPRRVG
jgi:hypothetical protein